MTAQILASELGSLVQDSKRKNSELKTAAEKSLQDLKSLPITSEAQLAADLARRPYFISPFLIACSTQNARFASSGVSGIQRLTISRALPKERLLEILEALKENVSLGHDVQLKILQALPSLLQNYSNEIRGELLSIALQICSALQNAKNPAVSNTAAATLQQLVTAVYDAVSAEDEKSLEIPTAGEVKVDTGSIAVRPAAHDAYKVFKDLNLIINGEKPETIRFSSISHAAVLELIESVLSNHGKIMSTHREQAHILRSLLMPMIIRSLSEQHPFPMTLRTIRILNLIIRNHMRIVPSECEMSLSLLNHMLDPEASPLWKRALCLEVFRGIYSDFRLILDIYRQFDEVEGKRCIFGDNLGAFVRLATEKPSVIGLGYQSSVPTGRGDEKSSTSEQAVAEAGALAGVGVISGDASVPNSNYTGISTQWSVLKTPCIEHLDKMEPPHLPETYVYSLVLTCITNLSESLAKFVLPLTVPHEAKSRKKSKLEERPPEETTQNHTSDDTAPRGPRLSRASSYRKKSVPINPLTLTEHSAHSYVQTTSALVNDCWPAVLATCSTFLNAALDSDYYRALVRAIQKVTQVAGLLRLSTPRDAFLTTLGKAAVPSNLLLANISSPKTPSNEKASIFSNTKGLLSVDSLVSQASNMSLDKNLHASHDASTPSLSPRNLLCLRALLNLAIALGPTLQTAWSIVFETLQMADLVMSVSSYPSSGRESRSSTAVLNRPENEISAEKLEVETSAVQAAAKRLFESTADFPNESFVEFLQALCSLLHGKLATEGPPTSENTSTRPVALHQRRVGSVSGLSLTTESNARDSLFALNKIGELAALNETRLAENDAKESGWDVFVSELVQCCANGSKPIPTRILAADIIARTIKEIAELSMADEQCSQIQSRVLSALQAQISALHGGSDATNDDTYNDTDIKIHQIALEALKGIIEQCGESLVAGWDSVFDSLLSVFLRPHYNYAKDDKNKNVEQDGGIDRLQPTAIISRQLARSAFASVQLVCSDFLSAVPDKSLSTLLELLLAFCSQQEDLNMSLTTITFFWNVSDFLHSKGDLSSLPDILDTNVQYAKTRQLIQLHSARGSIPTLWLQVLLNLTAITTDSRAELRNSSVQTIQRIFENYADQLSPEAWSLCLRTVLFQIIEANLSAQTRVRTELRAPVPELTAWDETTKTVLISVSILLSTYMDKLNDPSRAGDVWSDVLNYLERYFRCGSHSLGFSVFNTISGVLSRIEDANTISMPSLVKTASIWTSYFDYQKEWQDSSEANQEAFVAYAEAFQAIYKLAHSSLDSKIIQMLSNLEGCIVRSDAVAYSSDIDHMTPLQARVIDCISSVKTSHPELPEFLLKLLARFSVLPYTSAAIYPGRRGPTFVSFAKVSMGLLESITVKHIGEEVILTSGAFTFALESLAQPITRKYVWEKEGKPPTLWQRATTTSLAILKPALSNIESRSLKSDEHRKIWGQIVQIACGIMRAQIDPTTSLLASLEKDEKFDVESFSKLRALITRSIGSSKVPDALRRSYTRNLFETSIIHKPSPGEIPSVIEAPLEDLYKIRYGHTHNPGSTFRTEMAYVCFSELVSLVSVHDGSTESIKLAQAAAPYFILRVAVALKAYIADQPLRGRMPAPESQRRELIFVLEKLQGLDSEPQAIPDAPGVSSKHKKHLHRLYPLLLKASRVARRDTEVFTNIIGLVDVVGDGFGLQDE